MANGKKNIPKQSNNCAPTTQKQNCDRKKKMKKQQQQHEETNTKRQYDRRAETVTAYWTKLKIIKHIETTYTARTPQTHCMGRNQSNWQTINSWVAVSRCCQPPVLCVASHLSAIVTFSPLPPPPPPSSSISLVLSTRHDFLSLNIQFMCIMRIRATIHWRHSARREPTKKKKNVK